MLGDLNGNIKSTFQRITGDIDIMSQPRVVDICEDNKLRAKKDSQFVPSDVR
jgi:hypothetical protein